MTFACYRISLLSFVCAAAFAQDVARGGAQNQQPAEKKEAKPAALPALPATLEEMLAVALRSNPEILKADAKVRKAQADLNQVRLKVTQQLITTYHERTKDTEALTVADEQEQNVKRMIAVGTMPQGALNESQLARANAKARIAQGEAQLRYVMGLGGSVAAGDGLPHPTIRAQDARQRPEMPKEVRAALKQEGDVNFEGLPIREVLAFVRESSGEKIIPMIDSLAIATTWDEVSVTLRLGKVPLRALLTALADLQGICFVFREYGILVTTPERAATMYAPCIPEETPLKLDGPSQQ